MNKDIILAEIRRTANANRGVPLGSDRFATETGVRELDWYGKYWMRWSDALAEAGFALGKKRNALEHHIIRAAINLIREIGRFPSKLDVRLKVSKDQDFPDHNQIYNRGKKRLIEEILDFCRGHTDYEDIVDVCNLATSYQFQVDNSPFAGFVYLMRSSGFYKIGRTNSIERRRSELSIQLPEKLTTVHQIATDDPVGVEAYWHRRFANNRVNGEWFRLSSEDVQAFLSRNSM